MTKHDQLIKLLMKGHAAAAMRDNASTQVFCAVAKASGNYTQALCAALLATGNLHAPVAAARRILETATEADIRAMVGDHTKVPGYGSSFAHGAPDDVWRGIDACLAADYWDSYVRLDTVAGWVSEAVGTRLYPNGAAYTAVVAMLTQCPHGAEMGLFALGRIPAYTCLWERVSE